MNWIALALAALLAMPLAPGAAEAQSDVRKETVRFPAGATGTTLKGRIVGRQSVSYLVGAEAGQRMTVSIVSRNTATSFNIYAPGRGPGDEALAVGETIGPLMADVNRFDATLSTSGTYTISVFMVRAAARRGERSDYTLDIRITDGEDRLREPVRNDFADGLQGGPDFWQVAGVAANDRLNVRAAPTAGAPVLARVANGAALRNLGCRMAEGGRWCRVETLGDVAVTGWAAGRFLIEGAGPVAATPPPPVTGPAGDALVPGTRFHATGTIPCAMAAGQPMGACEMGVVREGGGTASVTVTRPDGRKRLIFFERGRAVAADISRAEGDIRFSAAKDGDLSRVQIGTERYEIPDAVPFGG